MFRVPKNPSTFGPPCWIAMSSFLSDEGSQSLRCRSLPSPAPPCWYQPMAEDKRGYNNLREFITPAPVPKQPSSSAWWERSGKNL